MKCPACNKPQRNLGIGPVPLWHCDYCEMADTQPMTDPGFERTPTAPLQLDFSWKWPSNA
jgi:hypothetical protein